MTNHTLDQAQAQGQVPWTKQTVDLGSVKVFADGYPVTIGHRLFVPAQDSLENVVDCFRQAIKYGHTLVAQGNCDGFNVGMNWGTAAGQTVPYPHVHCIPRRTGDSADPTGGVRGVVSGQGNYRLPHYRNPHDT